MDRANLCEQEYWKQSRSVKGLLRQYLGKMTGLSRAQVTRLIRRYRETGAVRQRHVSAQPVREPLHAGRHRTAGRGG